jgi:hypothetical protein
VSAAGLDLDYRQPLADTGAGHRGVGGGGGLAAVDDRLQRGDLASAFDDPDVVLAEFTAGPLPILIEVFVQRPMTRYADLAPVEVSGVVQRVHALFEHSRTKGIRATAGPPVGSRRIVPRRRCACLVDLVIGATMPGWPHRCGATLA